MTPLFAALPSAPQQGRTAPLAAEGDLGLILGIACTLGGGMRAEVDKGGPIAAKPTHVFKKSVAVAHLVRHCVVHRCAFSSTVRW